MDASGTAKWAGLCGGRVVIFLTVGSQMPFDRLVKAVDLWAGACARQHDILAQIGDTGFRPQHMQYERALAPDKFKQACLDAEMIIGHAGMGTVLTAFELAKPLVVLPRHGARQETRNDHQVATARWLAQRAGVWVAWEVEDLPALIDGVLSHPIVDVPKPSVAEPRLVAALRKFILTD